MSERIKSFYKKLTHFGLASVLAFSSMAVAGPVFLDDTVSAAAAVTTQAELESALSGLDPIIELGGSFSTDSQITVSRSVIIDGNSHTIDGAFTRTNNGNNSVVGVQADDVVIKNLNVTSSVDGPWAPDGLGEHLHGINVYEASDVTLDTIFAYDFVASGIVVGQESKVSAINISTADNGWNGINVDKPGAHLTIYSGSQHDESYPAPDIYVDDTTVGQVTDVDGQYATNDDVFQAGDRVYVLNLQTPVLESPDDNGYTTSNNFYFEWQDVDSAISYEFQNSMTDDTDVDGSLSIVHYSSTTTDSELHSIGASDGTVRHWQVRAVDVFGVKSEWSNSWKMTIDMTTPSVPENLSWTNTDGAVANGGFTNLESGTAIWDASDADTERYVYHYWNDIQSSPYTGTSPWVNEGLMSPSAPGVFNQGEGTHYFSVAAVDYAGNISEFSTPFEVTYDNTNPVATITAPSDTDLLSGNVDISGSVIDDNLWRYYLVIKDSDGAVEFDKTVNTSEFSDESLYLWDTTAVADGEYTIFISARDLAGNKDGSQTTDGVSTDLITVVVDNTDPVVSIGTLETVEPGDTVTIEGTTDDDDAEIVVTIDGTDYSATNNGDGTWTVEITAPATDGDYTVTVVATDEAGNISDEATTTLVVVTPEGEPEETPETAGDNEPLTDPNPGFVAPAATDTDDGVVLGDQDDQTANTTDEDENTSEEDENGTEENGEIAGAVDEDEDGNMTLFGLAWYWWLLVLAGIVGAWYLLGAWRKRSEQ